jgi:predicted Zn-dependent protease with MMP-like domain
MNLSTAQFEQIVAEELDNLPEKFRDKINNLAILVEDHPTKEQKKKARIGQQFDLLGLYEGFVQSRRLNFGVVPPDRITIFRLPILKNCSNIDEARRRIKDTFLHEIAHHFGSDEQGARKAAKKIAK